MKKLLSVVLAGILLSTFIITCQKNGTQNMKQAEPKIFYVGTYTDGESEGIYKYRLFPGGRMEALGLSAKTENPSFLAKSPEDKFLLAVNEVKNDDGVGSVASFLISDDKLKLMSSRSSGGAHPCFVAVNEENVVITANYTGGNVGLLGLMDQGRLSDLMAVQQHEGQGTTERQQGPHAHSAWFKPATRQIISVDLGTNELWFSGYDLQDGSLSFTEADKLAMEPGAGPRMLAYHPNNKWIYVLNELNSTVSLVTQAEGEYGLTASFNTLPEGYSEPNTGAHLIISSDGKFLYSSNRGHDSIAVFEIAKDGSLKLLGHKSTGGKGPRHFSFSPDEKLILVANQHSNNIVSLKRNAQTGMLKYANQIEALTPVCLVF
jgi:6-phosphogluconolactonase